MKKIRDLWEILKGIVWSSSGLSVEMSWKCKRCGAWDWGTVWEMLTRYSCKNHRKV